MKYPKKRVDKPLGELLIEIGMITKSDLEEALKAQKAQGGMIGEVIVSLGFAKEEDIAYTLSLQYGFPYLPLQNYDVPKELVKVIPKEVAVKYCLVPIDQIGSTLTVAMANPLNPQAIDQVEYISKCEIQIFVATVSDVRETITRLYGEQ
jgi:type IV pilus assembly protein PilB